MTPALLSVLALLAIAIIMFVMNRPRMDAIALLMMCLLPLTGVIQVHEALAGLGDPNIVLIAALFVIGDGLVRTGVAQKLGDWLVSRAGSSKTRLTILLMVSVCTLGATMSSTAVTAIFIPVVLRICRNTGAAPGQLMMPLSAAALISGMTTLVATTPNLVVNAELVRRGHAGFQFFSFSPFGVPILAVAIVYMLFAVRRLPADLPVSAGSKFHRPSLADWVKRYRLDERQHRLRVRSGSPLAGKALEDLGLRSDCGANILAIQREHSLIQPTAKTQLNTGDILLIDLYSETTDRDALCEEYGLQPLPMNGNLFADHQQSLGMAEVMIPADSELPGKTVVAVGFRTRFGLSVVGIRRGVQSLEHGTRDTELRIGDTLLVVGPWKAIRSLQLPSCRDLVPLTLPVEFEDLLPASGRTINALFVLAIVITLMVTGVVSNVQAALFGCLLMGVLGCVSYESAYRSIDWKTLILIAGMMPFSVALQRTGAVDFVSGFLTSATSDLGTHLMLGMLFMTTSMLSMFISNTATAVLMAPIALSIADRLQVSPYPFAMIVALAASAAFMTPVSSPVNTLVVTPGGYRFADFVRVGVPLTLAVMVVSVLMVPLLLPL